MTRKCCKCKQDFLKTSMIEIFSASGKTSNWYCQQCAEERHARENFSNKVCEIFGIKSPGPRIWTERQRLQTTFGYTDDTLVDCLDYIYNVEKKDKLAESLCLINPTIVDQMQRWKQSQEYEAHKIVSAYQMETQEYVVPIQENTTDKKEEWNPDDWLDI